MRFPAHTAHQPEPARGNRAPFLAARKGRIKEHLLFLPRKCFSLDLVATL